MTIYILKSFDTLASLLAGDVSIHAVKILDFNKETLRRMFPEVDVRDLVSLVDEEHDMDILQDVSKAVGIVIPPRNPKTHPTWDDYEVRKGDRTIMSIKAGDIVFICKAGKGWDREWWYATITTKSLPPIPKDVYEKEIMQPWDAIRQLLLEEQNKGSLPRDMFETLIYDVYEMGYNKAVNNAKGDNI